MADDNANPALDYLNAVTWGRQFGDDLLAGMYGTRATISGDDTLASASRKMNTPPETASGATSALGALGKVGLTTAASLASIVPGGSAIVNAVQGKKPPGDESAKDKPPVWSKSLVKRVAVGMLGYGLVIVGALGLIGLSTAVSLVPGGSAIVGAVKGKK